MTPQEAMQIVRELVVLAKENFDGRKIESEALAARILDLDDFFRDRGLGGFVAVVEKVGQ